MTFFYLSTTDNFLRYDISGNAHVTIFNDNTLNPIAFSFDGTNIHGVIPQSQGISFPDLNEDSIFFRSFNLGSAGVFRMFAWGLRTIVYPEKQVSKSFISPPTPQISYEERIIIAPNVKGVK